MRMQMEDKKDHEPATGGDLTSKSASAESEDNLKGWENDSSSKMGQKGMSVVKESPGPGTNTDISATSQAPGKRIRTRSLTGSDGCSSQNWQDKEELEKRLSNFLVRKRSLKLKN
ncbi:uncharacterized protein LOC128167216 [Crassostrea angulata]|uniref:uncharacterized protein LOC128167216 n=1 Tax=Magallana angulata TaxID=2784310 RepID=UPI0022B1FC2F|nr:uncharacterized protein LOC128167216 [Crassostrea angulata]